VRAGRRATLRARACPAALAALVAALAAAKSPAQVASSGLASRLADRVAAGDADSTRALIRASRGLIPEVLETLLAMRGGHLLAGRPDSAAASLAVARTIADLYAAEFDDPFCRRTVAFQDSASREGSTAGASGWATLSRTRHLYQSARWPDAAAGALDAIRLADEARDPFLALRAHRLAGNCLHAMARFDEARAEYETALDLARRLDDPVGESRILSNLALTHQSQGRSVEAIGISRRVLDAARRLRDRELEAHALNTIGINFKTRGDLDSARAAFDEGLAVTSAAGLRSFQAALLTNRGDVLASLGAYEEAIASQNEALRVARELRLDTTKQEMSALIFLAGVYGNQERYSDALVALSDGLRIAEEAGAANEAAVLRTQMGAMCRLMGRPEEATAHYAEALRAQERAGSASLRMDLLHYLGLTQAETGRIDDAVATWEEGLRFAERQASRFGLATALGDLARGRRLRGDRRDAEALLARALAIADTLGHVALRAELEVELAGVLAAGGRVDRAAALYDDAVRRARAIGGTALVQEALVGRGRAARQGGDLAAADSLLAEAIALIESVRLQQAGEEIRMGFLSTRKAVYSERVSVLHERSARDGHDALLAEAFHVAERARARALLDVVSAGGLDPGEVAPAPLRERERRVAARLGTLQTEISRAAAAEEWDAARIDSLEGRLSEAGREYRALIEEISAGSPAYGALSGQREPLRADDVRGRVLQPGQMLIEYLVGEDESFVFVVGEEVFRCERIPAGAEALSARVRALRQAALGEGETPGAAAESLAAISTELHTLLIAPVARDLSDGARLLIVADGPLLYLPFAALRDGGRFLVESHPIGYAPSASVIDPAARARRRPPRRSCLAVGNPATYRAETLLAATRGATAWRFGELPYAEEEARRIARRFNDATTLVGKEATEEAVKAALPGASHVHLATHGLLNEEEPLLSGIALAQDEDPTEDGLLQVHEVLRLRLASDLVVLSACHTGLGRYAMGEGVLGLTRAFLHAGARTIVISLWEVGDRSTVELMDRFYAAHQDARRPADLALREAQAASIAAGRPPREWAAFAVVGETAAPSGRRGAAPSPGWILALAVAAALAALLLRATRMADPARSATKRARLPRRRFRALLPRRDLVGEQPQEQPNVRDDADRLSRAAVRELRHHRRVDVDANGLHPRRRHVADADAVEH
jgi:CHAT domain-containing protein